MQSVAFAGRGALACAPQVVEDARADVERRDRQVPGAGEAEPDELFDWRAYGKGAWVYTTFSWFRELPAGVPGAYRIFANLLSAGKTLHE